MTINDLNHSVYTNRSAIACWFFSDTCGDINKIEKRKTLWTNAEGGGDGLVLPGLKCLCLHLIFWKLDAYDGYYKKFSRIQINERFSRFQLLHNQAKLKMNKQLREWIECLYLKKYKEINLREWNGSKPFWTNIITFQVVSYIWSWISINEFSPSIKAGIYIYSNYISASHIQIPFIYSLLVFLGFY